MSASNSVPVLELTGIDKNYSGIPVLRDVQLRLYPGEIHALMGQNGAGKSTLIKVLTGVIEASGGQMRLGGETAPAAAPGRPKQGGTPSGGSDDPRSGGAWRAADRSAGPPQARSAPSGGSDPRSCGAWGPSTPWPDSPLAAQRLGISTVYQEVNLCANLSVAENIFAGRYPRHGITQGFRIDWATVNQRSRELVARIGLDIDVTRLLSDYPVAVQQLVAIARALSIKSRVLILDEPTSSLDDDEVQKLFEVLRRLRDEGLAIVFVTHFLNQVYAISDRITVLRNGSWVGEWPVAELGPQALIAAMLGRELAAQSTEAAVSPDFDEATPALLQAEGLGQTGQLQAMDLRVRAGEVVGLAGLLGSGRTELARLLFGLAEPDRGVLRIDGQTVSFSNPMDAIRQGLALCPEERKTDGIVAELSVRENIALALQARMGVGRFLSKAEQTAIAERYVKLLGIKTESVDKPIGLLSGGNQQKAILARWLAIEPRLLILDEPTRGIDVAAKQEIMEQIMRLAQGGMAVLFISSEMSEVVRVAHRIVVLRDRRKVGELPAGSSEDAVYEMIASA